MRIKKCGFTFIELVVSVTIMALLSIVGVSSFERFFKNSQMVGVKTKIINIIKNENDNLVSGEISSYKVTFATGSKAIFVNENYFKNSQIIDFDVIDFTNLSGSIITNNTSTGNWITKIYTDNMLTNTYLLSGSGEKLDLNFSGSNVFEKIEIKSFIDKIDTNKLILYRIDFSGNESENPQETIINSLSGSEQYNKISFENIVGNKTILVATGINSEMSYSGIININLLRGNQDLIFKLEN